MPSGPDDGPSDAPGNGAGSHRRTPSGGILSRLPFLRTTASSAINDDHGGPLHGLPSSSSTGAASPTSPPSPENHRDPVGVPSAASIMGKKTRSRKGSLRKTALLGTGRLWRDQLETIASPRLASANSNTSPAVSPTSQDPLSPLSLSTSNEEIDPAYDDYPTPRASSEINGTEYNVNAGYNGGKQRTAQKSTSSEEGLMFRGPRGRATRSDISTTTDEEESVDGGRESTANGISPSPAGLKQLPEDPSSYFSLKPGGILRKYSNKKPTPKSPLGSLPMDTNTATPEEWDYAETEWWGWIILIVTWIVFVVGMGSCFGVWSWAWDVGETPYAPPELEDDATLPIVGYYPALIILTGVMAWVWVIIAWVGMKYFKHAKMSGEE